jgi:NADH dehydrogenase
MQEGRYAAEVVKARLHGREQGPFRYRDKGNLATIGRARAVADLHVVKLSGFFAWLTWLLVHIWYLIGFQNRLLVLIRWSFSFFGRGRSGRVIEELDGAGVGSSAWQPTGRKSPASSTTPSPRETASSSGSTSPRT